MDEGISTTRLEDSAPDRLISLRRQLGVTGFGINQLVLEPGQQMRIHLHEHQEEVYLVLAGELTIYVEQEEHRLGPGELMRVAPNVRRQLVNRGAGAVSLIALGGTGEHQSRDARAFTGWEDQTGGSPREVPLPPDLAPEDRA